MQECKQSSMLLFPPVYHKSTPRGPLGGGGGAISQGEIKRIRGVPFQLINKRAGKAYCQTWADLFSSVFQPIYFVNPHFLLATDYYIFSQSSN